MRTVEQFRQTPEDRGETDAEREQLREIVDWRGRFFNRLMGGVVRTYTLGTMSREEARAAAMERLSGQSTVARRRWERVDTAPFLRVFKKAWEGTLGVDFASGKPLDTHQAMVRYGSALFLAGRDTLGILKPGISLAQAVIEGAQRAATNAEREDPGSDRSAIVRAAATFIEKNAPEVESYFEAYLGTNEREEHEEAA